VDYLIFLISVIFILAFFFTWMKPVKALVEILVLTDPFKEEVPSLFAC